MDSEPISDTRDRTRWDKLLMERWRVVEPGKIWMKNVEPLHERKVIGSSMVEGGLYLVQFCPGQRANRKGREKQGPVMIAAKVWEPRHPDHFHFGQTPPKQVMFEISAQGDERRAGETSWPTITSRFVSCGGVGPDWEEKDSKPNITPYSDSSGYTIAKKFPLHPLHMVLVPAGTGPQFVTLDGLRMALEFSSWSSVLHLGFNAWGCGSSVNHQHWTCVVQPAVFPVSQHVPRFLARHGDVNIYDIPTYPLTSALVFMHREATGSGGSGGSDMQRLMSLAYCVHSVVRTAQASNIAHNLLITPGSRRVILFLRHFVVAGRAAKKDLFHNLGFMEVSGCFTCVTLEQYHSVTTQAVTRALESISLPLPNLKIMYPLLYERIECNGKRASGHGKSFFPSAFKAVHRRSRSSV